MVALEDGLEPPTQWLTVTCSTDWAIREEALIIKDFMKMSNILKRFLNYFNK